MMLLVNLFLLCGKRKGLARQSEAIVLGIGIDRIKSLAVNAWTHASSLVSKDNCVEMLHCCKVIHHGLASFLFF
jgi:hypothetical protein